MPSARFCMLDRSANETPRDDAAGAPRPVRFRGGGFTPRAGRPSGWIALVPGVGVWHPARRAGWVNPLFLPAPSAIAVAIYKLALNGALWQHVSWSVMRIGSGW